MKSNMKRMLGCAAITLVLACGLAGQTVVPSREQIYAGLVGEWTGQLEYRDFSTDERVVLPAWLTVKPSGDGRSLQFIYTYDDGPTKTVVGSSTVTMADGKYSVTSDGDPASDPYRIEEGGAKPGFQGLKFALTGTGRENDKPVDVRITVTIERNLYRYKKETRSAGQDFNFRDEYVMTRRRPPMAKADTSPSPK
jgi:hypothetical protein